MNPYEPNITIAIHPPDEEKNYQIVELSGDMDKQGLAKIKPQLEQLSENFSYQYLVFDLSHLNFINSESIGFLMALYSHLVKMKKIFVITDAKEHVKDVLSVIGILGIIQYYDSIETFKKQIA